MKISNIVAQTMLPGLLFGYAALANVSVFSSGISLKEQQTVASMVNGQAAAKLDSLYKTQLPHRDASIGLIGMARYLVMGEGRKGVIVGDEGWLFSNEEFMAPRDPSVVVAAAADQIGRIRDELAIRDIRLLVVPLPAKADVYREHVGDSPAPEELANLYDDFSTALRSKSIATVDTRTALIGASKTDQVFLRTDTHWTPKGAQIVAKSVAEAETSLPSEQTFAVNDKESVQVQGDLTKFVTDAAYAPMVGLAPEKVTLRRAEAQVDPDAAALDLFGVDTSIPAVLVGTSYSANVNWSFAEDLKASMGVDVLNMAQEGLGPVAPMQAYLKGDTFRKTPPKLVIWEFPIRYLARADLWDGAKSPAPLQSAGTPGTGGNL